MMRRPDEPRDVAPATMGRRAFLTVTLLLQALMLLALVPVLRGDGLDLGPVGAGLMVAALFVGLPVHEGIHYGCFRWLGGVPAERLVMRLDWRRLLGSVACRGPVSARVYLMSALGPFVMLCLLPLALGVVGDDRVVQAVALLQGSACAGDLVLAALLLRFRGDTMLVRRRGGIGFDCAPGPAA